MAKTNSTSRPINNKQAAMRSDMSIAADIISQGATGFLFAAVMPDGALKWFAGGDLLGYDNATASAAMQLYVEAERCALKAA